jgi:hypothetical protein
MDVPEMSKMEKEIEESTANLDLQRIQNIAMLISDEKWREEANSTEIPSFPPPRFTVSEFPFQLSSASFSGMATEVGLYLIGRFYSDSQLGEKDGNQRGQDTLLIRLFLPALHKRSFPACGVFIEPILMFYKNYFRNVLFG